ncbi:MAG: ABC transporter ATP-binding protein [Clostridia bacterium]
MKELWSYLKDYKKESVLGPLFKMLEALFELAVPLVVAAIIDVGIGRGDGAYVWKMGLWLVALGVVGMISSVTAQYYAAKAAVGMATRMRHALFAHIQRFSYAQLDALGESTLVTRQTSDINQVQSGVNLTLRLFLRSPIVVFGAMIMAFTVDARAAWVFVVAIPVLSLVVFGIMIFTMPLYKKVQASLDKVVGITRENLSGARVIRAFGIESREVEAFNRENQRFTALQRFVGKLSALMNPLTYLIVNGALIALIWVGAVRVDAGLLTQGAVVALVSYMSQILVELVKLANLIITMTRSMACWARVKDVLHMPAGLAEGARESGATGAQRPLGTRESGGAQGPLGTRESGADGADAVRFENVFLRYPGAGAEALSGLSFCVKRGETIGVIGSTGSGKSSLVNLIPRFYEASGGTVLVDGRDVKDWDVAALRAQIGVVPQKAALFSGTVRSNLRWGNQGASDEQMIWALKTAQAWAFVSQKKGALDAPIEQKGRNLSGGQRQRLTIARALVKAPKILLLDDSASALDFATDAKLRKALSALAGETTVFIVSQRASGVMYADRILVLEDGRLAGVGSHASLIKDCAVYQEIYYSQFPREDAQ